MAGVEGRIALVTGASQGIGRACALVLAESGAKVALCARNQEKLEQLAEEIGGKGGEAAVFKMDVVKEEEIKAGVKAAIVRFGKIDILVNNAGVTRDQLIMRMKRADWDDVINQPDRTVSADPGGDRLHAEAALGANHQHHQHLRPNWPGGAGQLLLLEGGIDWIDDGGSARGGFAQYHRQCRFAGIHRDLHDRRTFPRTEREHPEEHSAGPRWNRPRCSACGEIPGVGRSRLHYRRGAEGQRRHSDGVNRSYNNFAGCAVSEIVKAIAAGKIEHNRARAQYFTCQPTVMWLPYS